MPGIYILPKSSFAMNFAVIDAGLMVKLLLLLLIGMGPKVALVPFLEKTKQLDAETQRAVGRRMVVTAVVTAIVLFATGWFLLRLLHISGGAVAMGGAIVLGSSPSTWPPSRPRRSRRW